MTHEENQPTCEFTHEDDLILEYQIQALDDARAELPESEEDDTI